MTYEEAKDKIQKLLALGESSNVNEAALAIEKANILMETFGIGKVDFCSDKIPVDPDNRKDFQKYKIMLASTIAELYGVISIRHVRKIPNVKKLSFTTVTYISFTGEDFYVNIACEMYSYLIGVIERAWKQNKKVLTERYTDKASRYHAQINFKLGMASQLVEKMEVFSTNVSWAPQRTEMLQNAQDFLKKNDKNIKTKESHTSLMGFGQGFSSGKEEAQKVNLNSQCGGVANEQRMIS